jgi:hypothetical protein
MNCSDLEKFFGAYFDGALSFEQSRAFHGHLSECDDCLTYCISYQLVVLTLREEHEYFRRLALARG